MRRGPLTQLGGQNGNVLARREARGPGTAEEPRIQRGRDIVAGAGDRCEYHDLHGGERDPSASVAGEGHLATGRGRYDRCEDKSGFCECGEIGHVLFQFSGLPAAEWGVRGTGLYHFNSLDLERRNRATASERANGERELF